LQDEIDLRDQGRDEPQVSESSKKTGALLALIGEAWFPVKEDVEDEAVSVPKNIAEIIRKHISDM
jgi:hypothetical protein